MDRRAFLSSTAAAGVTLAALSAGVSAAPTFKHRLKRAVIVGKPTEAVLKPLKAAGLDGVEATALIAPDEAAACRKVAEDLGLRIHSVLRGWAEFNSTNEKQVKGSWDVCATALRAAQGYGAEAVLIVPCRLTDRVAMPAPWEFNIKFDAKTGHLTQVVDGDNEKYQPYIKSHDRAWDTSFEQVSKLIDVAKETGVAIALENVWNNLWLDPKLFAAFVNSFNSPWVKAYFDIGNMVKYSPPQQWIRALGPKIAKCHVKDFKLNANGHDGRFCDPLDGSIDWHEVRRALDEVEYAGWLTNEGSDGLGPVERARRLTVIEAG